MFYLSDLTRFHLFILVKKMSKENTGNLFFWLDVILCSLKLLKSVHRGKNKTEHCAKVLRHPIS